MIRLILICVFVGSAAFFTGCSSKSKKPANLPSTEQAVKSYTCPMHPEIVSENPNDKCQRCGMQLVEKK
jgi:hypothetical protein